MPDGRTRERQVNLRERRLTSLVGFPSFEDMHTLFLQDNLLTSFDNIGVQPLVSAMHLDRNLIHDFTGACFDPSSRAACMLAATNPTRTVQHLRIE